MLVAMGDLLSTFPAGEYVDFAYIGYYDGERGLAQGFADAGDAIFTAWQSDPQSNDPLLLPLIHNYRHAIELALKQAIRQAAARLRFDGRGGPVLSADELDVYLKRKQGHRLGPLAEQLAGLLSRLKLGGLPPETLRLLARLHQLDPRGEAFRYANQMETKAQIVDVARLATLFREAFDMIHSGVLTMLDVHEQFQDDMYEERLRVCGDYRS
jgi:hypothetical protein